MFVVTDQWLIEHQSKPDAWTKDQIESLELAWPPPKGWKNRAIGKTISLESKARFEAALRSRNVRAAASLDLFGEVHRSAKIHS